jgi:hypothetical protein
VLVCVTELNSPAELDQYVSALKALSAPQGVGAR